MDKVAVVILNWNGKGFLEKFLPDVVRYSDYLWCKIIVADNASSDDSLEYLEKYFPEVERILLDKNYGFAGGYNKALEKIDAEYFLLLNSDIEVSENWLIPLVAALDSNPLIAGCSPKIRDYHHKDFFEYAGAAGGFIDKNGYAFCRGRIFDLLETDYGQYDDNIDVFWTTGACMLVRSGLFRLAGGFDARFFAHFEEIDFCWRMKNRGYRFVYVADSVVFHVGGGTLPKTNPQKTYLNFRNNLACMYKNLPDKYLCMKILGRLFLDGISGLRFLSQFKFADFAAIIKAHYSFFGSIGKFKEFRKRERKYITRDSHKEIYQGNIVKEFFLKKNKSFKSLKWNMKN